MTPEIEVTPEMVEAGMRADTWREGRRPNVAAIYRAMAKAAPKSEPGAATQLATALEALMERAFNRRLFPKETKAAFAALDAYDGTPTPPAQER